MPARRRGFAGPDERNRLQVDPEGDAAELRRDIDVLLTAIEDMGWSGSTNDEVVLTALNMVLEERRARLKRLEAASDAGPPG